MTDPQLPPSEPTLDNKPADWETTVAKERAAASAAKSSPSDPNWERATLEKLAVSYLSEQKTARRWRTFVRLAWLTFFVFLAWNVFYNGASTKEFTLDHTAVIEIKGEIASGADASTSFKCDLVRPPVFVASASIWLKSQS